MLLCFEQQFKLCAVCSLYGGNEYFPFCLKMTKVNWGKHSLQCIVILCRFQETGQQLHLNGDVYPTLSNIPNL